MKIISVFLLLFPTITFASDSYNPKTGIVHMPIVNVGTDSYEVKMLHQGDLVFLVTSAVLTSTTSTFSDSFDPETGILNIQNVSVGFENYEVTMIHLGNLVFKVTSATSIVKTGRFIDSSVEGVSYRTETRNGITNANGEFLYLVGETIVFGLGDLEFPAVTAAQILTPLELAGVTDINNTGVVNMARLLQSLDQDCDPGNGITIGGEALLAAAGMSLDFESPNFDTEVVNLVANGGQQNSACQVLIDASQAVAHLQQTLDNLNDQTTPPIGNGLAGKIGIWEGEGQQTGISWTIRIDIQANEQSITYPSLNCGGTLTLREEFDSQLLFWEDITYGPCLDGYMELTDQSASELIYRWYYPDANSQLGELGAIGSVTRTE